MDDKKDKIVDKIGIRGNTRDVKDCQLIDKDSDKKKMIQLPFKLIKSENLPHRRTGNKVVNLEHSLKLKVDLNQKSAGIEAKQTQLLKPN